jgi:hypothetical protein
MMKFDLVGKCSRVDEMDHRTKAVPRRKPNCRITNAQETSFSREQGIPFSLPHPCPAPRTPLREAGSKILVIKKAKNIQRKSNHKITKEKFP